MSARSAAPPPILAVSLFRDTLSRANHLKREARTLSDYEYRSPTPPRVARLICRIVETCEQEILAEWDNYRDAGISDEERHPILTNVQLWDSLLRAIGGQLRYINGASASRVPTGLGRLLETIIQQLELGDGILLREKWSYNYSVDFTPLEEDYERRLTGVLSPEQCIALFGGGHARPRTYAIGFPAIERENTLLHCAIAHEIGHIPVERWLTDAYDSNPAVAAESKAEARKLLRELIDQKMSGQEDVTVYSEIVNTTNRIVRARRRFLQEYGSDIFAVELFGPAALMALTNIAMSHGLDNEPNAEKGYYPSWRSRLRNMLEWLQRESADPWITSSADATVWGRALREHLDRLVVFLGASRPPTNPDMRAADHLAKQTLESLGPHLANLVTFPRGASMSQAYVLADRLETRTPPNDIGNDQRVPIPPHLAAILNAGWLHTIRHIHRDDQTNRSLEGGDDTAVVNRLLLKALSDVIIMQSYQQFRTEGEST